MDNGNRNIRMIVGLIVSNVSRLNFPAFGTVIADVIQENHELSQIEILLSEEFTSAGALDETLGRLYSITREVLINAGHFLLPVDIIFGNHAFKGRWDLLYINEEAMNSKALQSELCTKIEKYYEPQLPITHRDNNLKVGLDPSMLNTTHNQYDVSALGGTFDHLHDGHKILLSIAAFVTSSKLIVGVTDLELLKNKKHAGALESYDCRCYNVEKFLARLKPNLELRLVQLKDVAGPTGTVPEIKALIVSRETIAGGQTVNDTRKIKGLPLLDICVVNVLGGDEQDGWKEKMSSTAIRAHITSASQVKYET